MPEDTKFPHWKLDDITDVHRDEKWKVSLYRRVSGGDSHASQQVIVEFETISGFDCRVFPIVKAETGDKQQEWSTKFSFASTYNKHFSKPPSHMVERLTHNDRDSTVSWSIRPVDPLFGAVYVDLKLRPKNSEQGLHLRIATIGARFERSSKTVLQTETCGHD